MGTMCQLAKIPTKNVKFFTVPKWRYFFRSGRGRENSDINKERCVLKKCLCSNPSLGCKSSCICYNCKNPFGIHDVVAKLKEGKELNNLANSNVHVKYHRALLIIDKSNWPISININTNSKKEMYQYIAKVRERIIRSERIPHFNVISFEEDQLNNSGKTTKLKKLEKVKHF